MRKLIVSVFLILQTVAGFPQIQNETIDTVYVTDKVLNYNNVTWKTNTYPLIKSEFPDSAVIFSYSKSLSPSGTYTFSIQNGTFTLISAPEENSSIKCVDSVEVKINGINETLFKYEPRGFIFDGEGCIFFSKKYGIVASSAYAHKVKRLVTEWDGTKFKLDTLLNYKTVNLLENNRKITQPQK